jgi:hypothetical protein
MIIFNRDVCYNVLAEVLRINNKFSSLRSGNIETIINYLKYVVTTDSLLKSFSNDLINCAKGIGGDAIIQYEMKLALYERKQKLDLNKK